MDVSMQEKKILKNTSMLLIFNIAKMLFPFITLPYLTRVFTTETYGTVAYVKTVMNYMQIVVDFGFMLSATKDIVNAQNDKEKMERAIGETLLAKILLWLIALLVLLVLICVLPILRVNVAYTLLSFVVVFESIFLMDFLFRGLEIMHIITIRFVLMKTISTVLTFVLVKNDRELLLIPLLDILGSFIAVILVIYEMRKMDLKICFTGMKKVVSSIKDSFVYFISNMASMSFNALGTLIIGIELTGTEVAYWSVCMQMVNAVQAMYTPITDGIYPEMIKTRDIGLIKKILKYMVPILTMGCICVFFMAEIILNILGGKEYVNAVPVFRWLIPVLFFGFLAILFGWPTLGVIGKTKETTATTVISAIVQIICLAILIVTNRFTLITVAIVRSVTELVLFSTRFGCFLKYKNILNDKKKG